MNMPGGSSREEAEDKLIVLYMLKKLNIRISNLQLTGLMLENKLMNYFCLQQYLDELCKSGMLDAETNGGKTLYGITESGRQTLGYFQNFIPEGVKARIDGSVSSMRGKIRNETLITADYAPESENKYTVSCKISEDDFSLIDLSIAVGTKNDARAICDNWKRHTQEIYSEIIETLTKKRD